MKSVLGVLKERGFFAQVTDEEALDEHLQKPVTVYSGFDPTAKSLHVGSLLPILTLKHFELAGHKPIALVGGGTALVGDPSGKTELRQMLTTETIDQNCEGLRSQLQRFLDISGGKTVLVNNADWLCQLNYIEFLRDVGRHFSVNRMLSAESYKQRMEKGLSFIEFNYQILQAYDFLELNQRYSCTVQVGGDDQWGNILAGVDLTRRKAQTLVHGLTFPLLLTSSGQKMGKTAKGAVWLDPELFSPYDFFQYWVNIDDADLTRMLGFFSFLPMEEIRACEHLKDAQLNAAKSILAFEVTQLVHGKQEAEKALAAAFGSFGARDIPKEILPSSEIPKTQSGAASQIPTTKLSTDELNQGLPIADVMVRVELAPSKGAARRLIKQNAVRLGESKIQDEHHRITAADITQDGTLLRAGKKKVHRLVLD